MQSSRKLLIMGHFGVGKTSLVRRFVENSFSDNYKVTIGVHIAKKVVTLDDGHELSLIIWDLEGTDEIETVRDSYLLGSHGVFYVFDVTRPSTFQNLKQDLEYINNKLPNIPSITIGNKMDLTSKKVVQASFKELDIPYDVLVSAKTGEAVEGAFHKMAKWLHDNARGV